MVNPDITIFREEALNSIKRVHLTALPEADRPARRSGGHSAAAFGLASCRQVTLVVG